MTNLSLTILWFVAIHSSASRIAISSAAYTLDESAILITFRYPTSGITTAAVVEC